MARIGSGHYGMPGGIRRPIIDQAWYERAADIIGGTDSTAEERLGALNEIWQEYLLETNEFHYPRQAVLVNVDIPKDVIAQAVAEATYAATGYTFDQIVEFAIEKKANDAGFLIPGKDPCDGCDGRSSVERGLPYQCLYCKRNYGDKHDKTKRGVEANGTKETETAAASAE